MENVHVVIGIGCTPVVHVFDNREAADTCQGILENSYDKTYVYHDVEVRDVFSKFICPRCGATEFQMSWTQPFDITVGYDPESDSFDVYGSHTNLDDSDPEDIEVSCDSCGASIGDSELEERLFGFI